MTRHTLFWTLVAIRLLSRGFWFPGRYLLPEGWKIHISHGGTFLTVSMITDEMLAILARNLTFTQHLRRKGCGLQVEGVRPPYARRKSGDTLYIRKPPRYHSDFGVPLEFSDA